MEIKKTILNIIFSFFGMYFLSLNTSEEVKSYMEPEIAPQVKHAAPPVIKKNKKQSKKEKKNIADFSEEFDDSLTFNEEGKRKEVINLVHQGMEFFNTHSIQESAHKFTYGKEFIVGELYIFLIDYKGRILAHGDQQELLWKNMLNVKDQFGNYFVKEMIEKIHAGGGWLTYEWRNAVKESYVQRVVKNGKEYVIGAGYYPHSKKDTVVSLVKGAVSLAKKFVKKGEPIEEAFGVMSYRGGQQFVRGDLYIYGLDENGIQVAHGERPGLVSSNALEYQDANGKYVNKEIFAALSKNPTGGAWVEYISKGARKLAYAELVFGADGKKYFVACGYHPDETRDDAVELVRKAYAFMKTNGKTASINTFSDIRELQFHKGDLYISVYDMQGMCVADGANIENNGKNMHDIKDQEGKLYMQEMIALADKMGTGWVDVMLNNSFLSIYLEKIDLGLEKFIITCGMYPVEKSQVIALLVKSAVSEFQNMELPDACQAFISPKGSFMRGDLSIFVFDDQGFCYAYGDQFDLVWKNLINLKDDAGKPFIKLMIESAKNGATHLNFLRKRKTYVSYIQRVEKDGVGYTIGSGFYK